MYRVKGRDMHPTQSIDNNKDLSIEQSVTDTIYALIFAGLNFRRSRVFTFIFSQFVTSPQTLIFAG